MKIKKKIKKKSGSKTEILRNTEAQPKQLVSYKKKECTLPYTTLYSVSRCYGCSTKSWEWNPLPQKNIELSSPVKFQ